MAIEIQDSKVVACHGISFYTSSASVQSRALTKVVGKHKAHTYRCKAEELLNKTTSDLVVSLLSS